MITVQCGVCKTGRGRLWRLRDERDARSASSSVSARIDGMDARTAVFAFLSENIFHVKSDKLHIISLFSKVPYAVPDNKVMWRTFYIQTPAAYCVLHRKVGKRVRFSSLFYSRGGFYTLMRLRRGVDFVNAQGSRSPVRVAF